MEDYKLKFIKRTLKHIELVNKYALKLGKAYPNHDIDKLTTLFEGYSLMSKENPTEEESKLIDKATLEHIAFTSHHAEHWTTTDISKFTRKEPTMNCDCTLMPEHAIDEMLADWAAMSEEFNNTPLEWADKVINKRWLFNEEQVTYIYNKLEELWETK